MQLTVRDAKNIETTVTMAPMFPGASTQRVTLDGIHIGDVIETSGAIGGRLYRFASTEDAAAACVSHIRYGYWTREL